MINKLTTEIATALVVRIEALQEQIDAVLWRKRQWPPCERWLLACFLAIVVVSVSAFAVPKEAASFVHKHGQQFVGVGVIPKPVASFVAQEARSIQRQAEIDATALLTSFDMDD